MSHEDAWKLQKWAWAVFVAVFLAGCGFGGAAHKPPSKGVDAVVNMGFMVFQPSSVTIRRGDTVEWRNTSLVTHTVTGDPRKPDRPGLVSLPSGAAPFDSGSLKAGKTFRHTFTVPGTYRYYCEVHDGMTGAVVVNR